MTDKERFNNQWPSHEEFQRELLAKQFEETDKKMEICRKELHTYGALAKLYFYITELEHETRKALAKARGLV